jgi:signal transduction histidine kinase/ActR/RegA family two-component response regulator
MHKRSLISDFLLRVPESLSRSDYVPLEEQLRRTVETLKRQQEELRTLLDVVPIGVLVARDPNADDIVGSASFAALTGMPPGENVSQSGPNRDDLTYHYERQGRRLEPAELPMQRAARLREVVRDMEMDMVFDDGRVVHVLAQATPLFDEQGNVRGAVGANIDISPLVLARRALEAVDRQKNDFIATLAHELRNPLAPIRYAIAILKRDPSPESIEHVVRVVDRQAGHMAHLLDDLLDLSRITRNAVELRREAVELHAVLDAAVENAQPMLQGYGQTLQKDIEPAPLWVHGDAVRLLQVVDNVLSNASKYTGAGGRITLRARREDDWCAIEVSDNGVGISEHQFAGLFTMFGRVDPAMGAAKAGLGIGLAISRRLVELHGGTIAARSDGLGKGSTFTVRLPRLERDAPANDPAAPVDGPTTTDAELGALQVLVVDDNIDAAETLRIVLALAGVKTGVAHSAAAALATAEAMRPDVVLLDLGLPDGNGVEVARRIRSTEWGSKPLLVALTGWGRLEDRALTDEAGFDLHLVKPVDGDQVLALLARFARSLQQQR